MRVLFERNVACTMRDGVVLRANVFRPDDDGTYPVVLTRLPYGKDTSFSYAMLDPVRLAESGYIVVIQDVRGRFASGGAYGGFAQEFDDGYDTVDWASKLPGSNGSVGMYGASYFGFTQLAAAVGGHPALKTLAPTVVFHDAWDGVSFRGGALEWGMMASWYTAAIAVPEMARTMARDENFLAHFGRLVFDIDNLSEVGYFELPLSNFTPLRRNGLLPNFFNEMKRDAEFLQRTSIVTHYPEMHVSASYTGGWYDAFLNSTIDSYQKVKSSGHPARLLIGPWTHSNYSDTVGDMYFGMAANSAFLELREDPTARHQRWFDSELKGAPNGVLDEPPIKYFTMGENRFKTAYEWPLPETVYTPFYFHSNGQAQSVRGDGRLNTSQPTDEPADEYVYNPGDPVLTYGGNLLMTHAYPPGPKDQAKTEARNDVLVYTSDVLEDRVEITGPVQARLWVTSSAVDTDFVVRLTDVYPDGQSINLVDGIVRMSARNGTLEHDLMEPGEVYPITIDCWATSNVFLPGHRIRVQVTSSNFPKWNRNLNTGASNEDTAEYVSATQQILHDEEHPSHIVLPVIPR